MAITLKNYQQRTLAALEEYFRLARIMGSPKEAFERFVKENPTDTIPQTYRHRWELTDVPYVCLRLPTGGGKTLLASHAVHIAAKNFMERDYPLVLWLVPTNTIRKQTADALKDPSHPYREALNDAFGYGNVVVFDIEDINAIRPKDLSDKACIVLATMQTLRVSDANKEARKVYGHNENFEPHFKALPNIAPGLDRMDDKEDGQVLFSFVNILHQLRPLVIVDEAHKAVSGLSGEMMQRINPSCVIEMTATPVDSNVLYRVYASDLKKEEMVKLPFMLTEHGNWEQAINGAVQTRKKLAELAAQDTDGYIRPIVLFQAEKKNLRYTVDVLKQHLIDNEGINESEIAIATGEQRGLDEINLFDKTCPINYVITIEALKEGWDCSFAYVFCSVAQTRSSIDVEQLLGRVMRMPYAKKRRIEALNKAYAHAVSPSFATAVDEMYQNLVNMGFDASEAAESIIHNPQLPGIDIHQLPLMRGTADDAVLVLHVSKKPNLSSLPEEEQQNIVIQESTTGTFTVEYRGEGSSEVEAIVIAAAPKKQAEEIKRQFAIHRVKKAQAKPPCPAQRKELFAVGQVLLNLWGSKELPEQETILMAVDWSPLKYSNGLTPEQFHYNEQARTFEFDLNGEKMQYREADRQTEYTLLAGASILKEHNLVIWLDTQCRQNDIRQPDLMEFCRRSVQALINQGGYDLGLLSRAKYALAAALTDNINQLRKKALQEGYQQLFFSKERAVEVDFSEPHVFPFEDYALTIAPYTGAYTFKKHYYPVPRGLEPKGEEFECARIIDMHPKVKFWVRNVDRQEGSFRLPLHDGWFYPDFVAELEDGRQLVVEYKGGHIATSEDTARKNLIGELWMKEGKGKNLFLMATKTDEQGKMLDQQIAGIIG